MDIGKMAISCLFAGSLAAVPAWGVVYTAGECDTSLMTHRWSFTGDYTDSVGGVTAVPEGVVTLGATAATTTGGTNGSGYINLGLVSSVLPTDGSAVTIEIWATQQGVYTWSRVFDIGPNNQNYLTLAWNYQSNTAKDRLEIKKNNTALITVDDKLCGYVLGTEYHISITIEPAADGKAALRWVRRDARTGAILKQGSGTTNAAWTFADIATGSFFLGHSQYYPTDLNANATYNEVRIWNTKLSDAQLEWSARLGADTLPTSAAASAETATISATAESGGKIAIDGATAAASDSTAVAKNQLVTLVATADANYHFTGWIGDVGMIQSGTAADATITVYAASAAALTATFRQNTTTWIGLGVDNLWSTAANWQDSLPPVDHAQLVFNGDVRTTNQNDLVTALDKITFGANAAEHRLTGNAVTLVALENLSSATQTVDLAVTAPTLEITGSGMTIFNQQVASTATDIASGANVVIAGKLSSTGNFDKTGAGTLQLRQGQNAQTVTAKKGTLVYSGDGTETSTLRELRSGETDADAAKFSIASGTVGASGSFVVTRAGTVDQSGGTVTLGDTLYVGYEGTGGVYNMTGGTMSIPSKTFAINVGNKAGSKGVFNVSGNSTITDQGNMQVGLYGNGELNQSGGTISVTSWPAIGRYAGAYGVYNISGGTLRQLNASCGLIVGEEGNGVMNISGTGVVESAGPFYIGHAANATGEVNVFAGGKIIAPLVGFRNASKSSRLYVDGGTIAAAGSGQTRTNFLGVPAMGVGPRGMTIDTGNNTVSVGEPFLKISASGPIVKTGSGTLTAPAASTAPIQVQEGTLQASDDALPEYVGFLDESALLHRWSLNGDLRDSVGGTTGTMEGAAAWNDATNPTGVDLTGGAYGTSCVKLGTNMLPTDGSAVTIEIWGKLHAARNYSRVFNISWAVANQFTITWCAGTDATKVVPYIVTGGANALSVTVTTGSLLEKNIHLTMTVEPQADGKSKIGWVWRDLDARTVLVSGSSVTSRAWTPAAIAAGELMLGRSADTLDGDASASYDEVRIWKGVLPTAQLDRSAQLGPDYLPVVPLAKKFPAIDVAGGATFAYGANNLTTEQLSGVGTVTGSGTLTVTEKLDIAGTGVGTMTLGGNLAVSGEWVVDVGDDGACDSLTGSGTLNLANAVISVRSPSKIRGPCVIATVGSVSGLDGVRLVDLPRRRLSYAEGKLSIVSDGLYIILR